MSIVYGQGFLPYSGGSVPHDCPFGLVGPYNLAGWTDPTYMGDDLLRTRKLSEDVAVMRGFFEIADSSGYSTFWADDYMTSPLDGSILGGVNPYNPGGNISVIPGSGINPSNGVNPFNPNNNGGAAGGGAAGGVGGSANDDLHAPAADDYQSQLNARLSLIEKYCDRWGKTVDVDKIREEFASDPQAGVEHCDDILNNKFDQGKLSSIVEKEYKDYLNSHIEKGKKVSDAWVKEAIENGTEDPDFSTAGVNANTILDVIGTFMTNDDVKNGKVSLENVFEQPEVAAKLVESMKQKADQYLLDENIDDSIKDQLVSYIETMRNTYDEFVKEPSIAKRTAMIKGFTDAFAVMRTEQARHNDEAAPQYYGLPEDSSIEFSNFSKRADEEIKAHKNRRKLRTNI